MKIKYQPFLDGRVGGACPPYRDHHVSKNISVSNGLDTPHHASASLSLRSARRGYSTNGVLYETH
jgi:hypothetical protein